MDRNKKMGYLLKEIDFSDIPVELSSNLVKCPPSNSPILSADELQNLNAADEVWILKCPKNVNLLDVLQGKKIKLDSDANSSTLFNSENDSRAFESVAIPVTEESGKGMATLLPDESGNLQIVSFSITGHILLREKIEALDPPEVFDSTPITSIHQLPEGAKIRHPIYGTDFTQILLKEANLNYNNCDKDYSKSKKKKKRKHDEIEKEPEDEEEVVVSKKKKKIVEVEVLVKEENVSKKKSKKSKL